MTQLENKGEMNLTELIAKGIGLVRLWWKQRWIMAGLAILGASIAFFYASSTKQITYTSRITFVMAGGAPTSGLSSLASQFGLPDGGGASSSLFSNENAIFLLKSQRILEQTLLKNYKNNPDSNLYNQYLVRHFPKQVENKIVHLISSEIVRDSLSRADDSTLAAVTKALNSQIIAERLDKKSNIIEVIVQGTDENWILDFSKVLVQEYSNLQVQLKVGNIKTSIQVLEHRLDSVQGAMRAAMYGVAQESDQSLGIIQAKPRVESGKKQMEAQLLSGLYAEIYKSLEMTRYSLDREQPVIEILDYPRLPLQMTGRGRGKFAFLGGLIAIVLVTAYVLVKYLIEDILKYEKAETNLMP